MGESRPSTTEHGSSSGLGHHNIVKSANRSTINQFGHVGIMNYFHSPKAERIIPRELHREPRPWVDRDDLLTDLKSHAEMAHRGEGPVVVAINGGAGVGKTALPSKFAAPLENEFFPDGSIVLDMEGSAADSITSTHDTLCKLLERLGDDDSQWPNDTYGLTARWRSLTSSMKLLVVLDNLTVPAVLDRLWPNGKNTMVVAIAQQNELELRAMGASPVSVERLSDDDCLELIQAFCGSPRIESDPDSAKRIAELCDGRPSHARLIGASIGAKPDKALAEIYRELLLDNGDLSLPGTGFGVVTAPTEGAIVNHSLNDLKPHQLKLLEDLSQHPTGDFSTPLASWLLGADAADDLRQLAHAQLIRAVGEGRWHLGESFSARKPDSNTEALGRILHWYLSSARVCDELVMGKNRLRLFSIETSSPWLYRPQTSAEASAWLLAEHRAIVKLQQRAYDVQLYRYVWGLEESAGWVVYQTCPLTDRWQETSPLAIAAAVEDGNRAAESRMCAQAVHLFIQLGDLDAASVQASKAAELAHEADHSRLAASAIEFQGVVYKERGDYQSAIENFRKALAINEKLGLARGAAYSTGSSANLLWHKVNTTRGVRSWTLRSSSSPPVTSLSFTPRTCWQR